MDRFNRRMWWFVIVGGFLMLAGLAIPAFRVDGKTPPLGIALVMGGTLTCLVGYALIIWRDWRDRNNRPPVDRGHL
jgi:hypothetical protein